MISFRLKCKTGHEFEGWFPSSSAYDEQRASGDIECPMCGDKKIDKALMAPAVSSRKESTLPAHEARAEEVAKEIVEAAYKLREHVEENCENVGTGFAEEARKIHDGDAE